MSTWFPPNYLKKKEHFSRTSFLFILIFGIALGYRLTGHCVGCGQSISWENNLESTYKKRESSTRHLTGLNEDTMNLLSLTEKYSCNTLKAFEELTLLHERAKDLEEHRRRGEANLARKGTVERKATAALAAENSFRKCVGTMMPELLTEWENKVRKGDLSSRGWNDAKEERIGGITFSTLEETADSLG